MFFRVLIILFLATSHLSGAEFEAIGPGGGGTPGAMAVDVDNPNVMYVALDCGGLHVTTNGGKTWSNANGGIDFERGHMGWNCHSSLLTLPGGIAIVSSDDGRIYISEDRGSTWKKAFQSDSGGITSLVRSPHDANTIYAGSTTRLGKNPSIISLKRTGKDGTAGRSGKIYASYESGRPGSWRRINTDKERNLPAKANVLGLAIDHRDKNLMYATTDYGLYRSADGGVSWDSIQDGLSEMVAKRVLTVRGKPGVVYVSVGDFVGKMPGKIPGVYRSDDSGKTWKAKCKGIAAGAKGFYALASDPINPDVLYLGCGDWYGGLYRSVDGGENWNILLSKKNSVASRNGIWHPEKRHVAVGRDICVSGKDRDKDGISDIITFIGDNVGHITMSTDGGRNWQQLVSRRKVINGREYWSGRGSIDFLCARRIVVDPTNPQHLWVAYFDWGLFESVDGGRSFRIAFGPWVNGELIGAVRGLVLDPDDPRIVYVSRAYGTRGGGGVLTNLGKKRFWMLGGFKRRIRGLPNRSTYDLLIIRDGGNKYLYASSNGEGIFRLNLKQTGRWEKVSDGIDLKNNPVFLTMACAGNKLPIYLSARDGVYRSDDGVSWKKISGAETENENITGVNGIAVDPCDGRKVYVTVTQSFRLLKQQGVYYSSNAGKTFAKIADVPIPFELAIDTASKTPLLYVASQSHGVYKISQAENGKWNCRVYADKRNGLDNTRCWTVTVDPHDPRRIYVGTHGTGVFKSAKYASDKMTGN